MRISDWSSDVCSSDLHPSATGSLPIFKPSLTVGLEQSRPRWRPETAERSARRMQRRCGAAVLRICCRSAVCMSVHLSGLSCCSRSEEHTSELQSLMRISYAVFCLTKKTTVTVQKKKRQEQSIDRKS